MPFEVHTKHFLFCAVWTGLKFIVGGGLYSGTSQCRDYLKCTDYRDVHITGFVKPRV